MKELDSWADVHEMAFWLLDNSLILKETDEVITLDIEAKEFRAMVEAGQSLNRTGLRKTW